jgi:hypothetical protein
MTKTFTLTDWRGSITLFKTFTGTRPFKEVTNASWEDIIKEIKPDSPNALEDKTKALCFLPCELKEAPLTGTSLTLAQEEGEPTVGKMRSKQHVTPANLLVIDIDGMPKASFDSALDKMHDDGITYMAYTTFSQGVKPDMRVRVVLPLDRKISVEEYPTAWHGFDELYFDGQIGKLDPSGAKLCQAQATWSCHLDQIKQAACWENTAEVLSADSLVTHAIEKNESIKVVAKERTDYPPSDANMVANACKQIGHFRDTRGADQPEPYWFDCLGIVGHCEDGERISHEWSSGHDDYNHFQTEKKLAHRLATPPTTCDQFKQSNPKGCDGCTQSCRSPIKLGYKRDDDAVIKALVNLDVFDYDRVRQGKAEELGVKVTTLDAKVKEERKQQESTKTLLLPNVAPYSEAVNLAILLNQVKGLVRKHLILDDVYVDILTLWIAGTWFVPYVQIFPLLLIDAPERGCGKSQVLDLASFMAYRPLATANITPAALFRVVELEHPTLFIDEADTFIKKHDDMLGLINDGYARTTHGKVARGVIRLTGDNFTPSLFDVWGAKALAGIKLASHLPDSTLSRGLKIHVRKKLKNESIVRLRHADTSVFDEICSKFARIALDHGEQVKNARPDLPSELNDRDQDNLEVLLAISEIAGAEWSERVKKAALKLAKEGDSDISAGNELLSDIRNIAKFRRAGKIHSTELLNLLVNDELTLWPTYTNGKALTSRGLASLLNFYGIKAKDLKFEGRTLKGFDWAQFEDAFERYLEPEILPQPRNDTSEPLIYKASGVADDPQPKSTVAQRYDNLLEDIF